MRGFLGGGGEGDDGGEGEGEAGDYQEYAPGEGVSFLARWLLGLWEGGGTGWLGFKREHFDAGVGGCGRIGFHSGVGGDSRAMGALAGGIGVSKGANELK